MVEQSPSKIAFALPHLKAGGIETVVLAVLSGLDRNRWQPLLILNQQTGELLAKVPADVPVVGCGGHGMLRRAWSLATLLRHHQPALLYSGTNAMNLSAILAAQLLARRNRPRLVISEHTTADNYLAGARHAWLRKALVQRLYPRADRLVAPLASLGVGWVQAAQLTGPPVVTLPNPVLDLATLKQLQSNPPNRVAGRIMAAGRLVADKGHDVLIQAFAQVQKLYPHTELLIYGQGPDHTSLLQLAQELGIGQRVSLMGYSNTLLRDFATAQLAVLPSRREGFGNVAVEAMAAGTPLIASSCPGPQAILQAGRLGTLVPPGDVDALAQAMATSLRQPPLLSQLERAREAVTPYVHEQAVRAFDALATELVYGTMSRHVSSSHASNSITPANKPEIAGQTDTSGPS